MSNKRAFSLIEVGISMALVGLLGAGALSLVQTVSKETSGGRLRAIAIADAQQSIDRIYNVASIASAHGGSTRLCEALESASGPMSVAGGGSLSGTCPQRTATAIPIVGTSLARTITISSVAVGAASAHEVVVTISGGNLQLPVVTKTLLPLGGA